MRPKRTVSISGRFTRRGTSRGPALRTLSFLFALLLTLGAGITAAANQQEPPAAPFVDAASVTRTADSPNDETSDWRRLAFQELTPRLDLHPHLPGSDFAAAEPCNSEAFGEDDSTDDGLRSSRAVEDGGASRPFAHETFASPASLGTLCRSPRAPPAPRRFA